MSKRLLTVSLVVLCLGAPAAARQTPPAAPKPTTTGSEAAAETQAEKRSPPPAEQPQPEGQPVNIRLDLTISDHHGAGEPAKRAVTIIVADRHVGYIRTSGTNRTPGVTSSVLLNVDARPHILANGKVRVGISLQYTPAATDPTVAVSSLNQQFTLILDPGKPFLMSEAADPLSNRKMTVEGRVTIMK